MSETAVNDGSGGRAFGRAKSGAAGVTSVSKRGGGMRMSKTTVLRLFVLLLAGASGYAAVQLASTQEPGPSVAAVPVAAPVQETEDVLIANAELPLGKVITPEDLAWVAWPKKLVSEQALRRSASPKLREEMIGSMVRSSLLKGEPIRAEKIVKATGSGILAAMLPTGYRAMAITIDSQGATTAGGFILPNDRVDVLRTMTRVDPARAEGKIESETLLANVRVLAIGQNIQERNGERVVTGSNATLEVDPSQAELLAQAQRSGQISLTLRSMADSGLKPSTVAGSVAAHGSQAGLLTVGVLRGGKRQEYSVRELTN
ncbi:MAG: cpaB [Hyphomicrobiales bacterium]|nr:cpaB [Hyphomicrobiales bacterium]